MKQKTLPFNPFKGMDTTPLLVKPKLWDGRTMTEKERDPRHHNLDFTCTRYAFICGNGERYKGKCGEFCLYLERDDGRNYHGLYSIKGTNADGKVIWEQTEKGVKDARRIARQLASGRFCDPK